MASQTLVFILLPNGITARKTLSLSVYLTPRLDKGATLADFPDMLHWAATVREKGLKFEIACGAKTATVAVDVRPLRPDVYEQVFPPTAFVEAFVAPDFDKRLIVSYPVRDALTFLKWAYQTVGSGLVAGDEERSGLAVVLQDLSFREGANSLLDAQMSQMRVQMWREQQAAASGGGGAAPRTDAGVAPAPPPDGTPTVLRQPANTHDTMTRFALFHHLPPAPNRPPLPSGAAGFARTLDFHRALTALSSYPWLLRALGLVFDVEAPGDLCPESPLGGAYGTVAVRNVIPGFKWALAPAFSFPATAYVRGKASFLAAPATAPADLKTRNYAAGDVIDGFLALPADGFQLLPVDLDGGLLKALTLADNVALADDPSTLGDSLPALRSAGVGLIANGRAVQLLRSIQDNKAFDQALTAGTAFPRSFNVRDLVRGFRIDVWSSRTRQWYSLHRRSGTYRFGPHNQVAVAVKEEEGFLQPTAAQPADDPTRKPDPVATAAGAPQPGTDLYVHERVARWAGWSLSAPRPGKPLNRSPDPGQALASDPTLGQPLTPFKMTTSFAATAGSLPELRFGLKYRSRVRAVDLAGNSVPMSSQAPTPFTLPADGGELPYLRFEPVAPPLLVLLKPTQAGGSLERLVIRAFNSTPALDVAPTTEVDRRHVAPPRVSAQTAEQHGMFDDAHGKLRGDRATYDLIVSRDNYEFPTTVVAGHSVPLVPGPRLEVSYLPDPLARGAALRNLPGAPDNTNGRLGKNGLRYETLPDVQPRPGSVTYIDFGAQWPQRMSFLLSLADGDAPPRWDAVGRELTVSLPKGATVAVDLSSYVSARDLTLMGVWGWLCELFETLEVAALQGGAADYALTTAADLTALLTRLVLEGGLDLLTPARTLTLVHAMQQPLGVPTFVQLPVVHQSADPILASALRNSFTPITAWRSVGSHTAVLLGALQINGRSTARIDLQARWLELTDDVSRPALTETWTGDHVETIALVNTDAGPIAADATSTRLVAVYVPSVDALWFAAPFDELAGVTTPSAVAAPIHRFDDSKHRWVTYRAVATSRYQEYFPAGLDFTRSGEPLIVDVPSSARPTAPDVAYVVPTFGWERQETTNVKTSVRFGNGVRVYLGRPWYSSGADELLGVVLWNQDTPAPDYGTAEKYKAFFSQWGKDPIWKTNDLWESYPSVGDFPASVASASGLALEETPQPFDVAGHAVAFDKQRGLWYCDIQFSLSNTYAPFVRLALARYQPHSIQGVELSRVVLADFAQLAPNRSAVLSIDPANTRIARLFVGGVAPAAPTTSQIEVAVERRLPNVQTDLGWEAAPVGVVRVAEASPDAVEADAVLWSGTVVFAKTPQPGQFRLVVREYERLPIDPPAAGGFDGPPTGRRLVYAAILAYDYPS